MRGVHSIAPKIGMRILGGEGMGLPSGGQGKWVVSSNEGLTEEGELMVFLCMIVCLVHSTSES